MRPLALILLFTRILSADALNCINHSADSPGLGAHIEKETLVVAWAGEHGTPLRASFAIEGAAPVVRELAAGGAVVARNLRPEFTTVSGVRRAAHGLDYEHRWDVFWDAPLSIPGNGENPGLPRKPEEIRKGTSSFDTHACEVRQEGARIEISFPGLSLGIFSGRIQFTVYRGSNLVRMEAIAKTDEPSVAYKYTAGLQGFSTQDLTRIRMARCRRQPAEVRVRRDTQSRRPTAHRAQPAGDSRGRCGKPRGFSTTAPVFLRARDRSEQRVRLVPQRYGE